MLHYITLPYITLHCITLIAPPHMQLQLHCANCTTPQLQLRHTTSTTTAALHHTTSSSCRWPLQPFQKTQLQPPFGPSVDLLCHPWFTTTNLSSRFPIFETSATALCGTTGMTLHYLSIIFRALTVNIILYMCVRVGMRTRGHRWNPEGWTQRGLSLRGVSLFDMTSHVQQRAPKTSSTWKIMEAASSLTSSHC